MVPGRFRTAVYGDPRVSYVDVVPGIGGTENGPRVHGGRASTEGARAVVRPGAGGGRRRSAVDLGGAPALR